ncbi:unnamed protein product, partial [Callosobruchus maculatus]
QGHTAVCGNVLVPCPNKCGAYIPRIELKKHNRECINRTTRSSPRLPVNDHVTYEDVYDVPATRSLERHYNGYQKPETRLQEDISKLSKRLADIERRCAQQSHQNSQLPNVLQSCDAMKNNLMQHSLDIEKLRYHHKSFSDWRNNLEVQLNNLKQAAAMMQNAKKETDLHFMTLQDRIILLEKLQIEFSYMRDSFIQEQNYTRQMGKNVEQEFKDLKALFATENATSGALIDDQKRMIENLKHEIDDVKKTVDEQKAKLTNVVFDLRAASQIASEAVEKMEIQERDFAEAKKEISQIKLDLEILEGLSTSTEVIAMKPGRLIWKITDFENKMIRAKEFSSVFKSPIFFTHDYGYKVRVLMYMNGIKKWKDRYTLLCIHVLKGEYDMLLKWPCHIEATITVRDLEDVEKGKSISKFITAKRQCGDEESEEPQESSSSYIFIPHATLMKPNYVKENTMFIDIKIQKHSKLETNL